MKFRFVRFSTSFVRLEFKALVRRRQKFCRIMKLLDFCSSLEHLIGEKQLCP